MRDKPVSRPTDAREREADAAGAIAHDARTPGEDVFAESSVRVHRSSDADVVARAYRARAVTFGHDVFVRGGEPGPEKAEGRALLAHEMVHATRHADSGMVHRILDPSVVVILRMRTDEELYAQRDQVTAALEGAPAGSAQATELTETRDAIDGVLRSRGLPIARPATTSREGAQTYLQNEVVSFAGHDLRVATDAQVGIRRELPFSYHSGPTTGWNEHDRTYVDLENDGRYQVTAETRNHLEDDREVLFFTAYHLQRRTVDWIIGPDSLDEFTRNANDYSDRIVHPAPRAQPEVLPAAEGAVHGIRLTYLVQSLPRTQGTPTAYILQTNRFIVAPNVVYDRNEAPYAAYYIAYDREMHLNAFVVGPDSVQSFVDNVTSYERQANVAFAFGYPAPYQVETARMEDAIFRGEWGEAFWHIGRSWKEAVQDPGWWMSVIVSTAGAFASVPTPRAAAPPPALTMVRSGGAALESVGAAAPPIVAGTSAIPRTVGALALAQDTAPLVAVAPVRAPLVGLPTNPNPMPAMNPVPGVLGAAAGTLSQISSNTASAPLPQSATAQEPQDDTDPNLLFNLILPAEKAVHAPVYAAWVAAGRLWSEKPFDRGNPAQAGKWDRMLHPRASGTGMSWQTWQRGLDLGLSERQILRPTWSRTSGGVGMEVDHMVELQVTRHAERGLWDSALNYELLDTESNGASGRQLQQNIANERTRLATVTGNPAYRDITLRFDRVLVEGGSAGERWEADEIRDGEHLDYFEDL